MTTRSAMTTRELVLGTRGSQLALWQTGHVRSRLIASIPDLAVRVEVIKTLGDKILDSPLSRIGDKGLFTKEIEHALLERRIDFAVHSLKDLPTNLPEGLAIGAVLEREEVRDVFIANPGRAVESLANVPPGGTIATGSLRRKSQLLAHRPDLKIVDIRGNLNTRMSKLDASDWDGMVLAFAGVKRLGWEQRVTEILPLDVMLPAVGQGALAVEIRSDDDDTRTIVHTLHHAATEQAVLSERAFLRYLEGGCQVPIGTHARIERGELRLDALVGSLDGRRTVRGSISGPPEQADQLGTLLARQLLDKGAREILDEIRRNAPPVLPSDT